MVDNGASVIPAIIRDQQRELLEEWVQEQVNASTARTDLVSEAELRQQSSEFLKLFRDATAGGNLTDVMEPEWNEVRDMLASLSRSRAIRGFTPTETATFVLSLKRPTFTRLGVAVGDDATSLARETWVLTELLDRLALFTTEVFQQSREEVINRQQQELMELSTPVVKLWDGILAVPLIGTLDSARTQVVMESLLQRIVDTGARIAIIDITGVPTVDTLVAQHLIKTVAAARLMGAECIISGIRPQIAQTIVHLGVELVGAVTKATLADAILLALRQTGWTVSQSKG
jgi:rsbT co-antagonist protein RsbR